MGFFLALIISYVTRAAVLTLLLWIMIKSQKLNYSFLGLLGSAALASAFDSIPYVGHYLAVPLLYFCIWKVTQASLMPDAIFTVVVAYALMFAVRVLLLTALLPPVHAVVADHDLFEPPAHIVVAEPVPAFVVAPLTNRTAAAAAAAAKTADDWLIGVIVKGATENGSKSMLLIRSSTNSYELTMGRRMTVQTTTGSCQMELKNVSENWATVEVNGEAAYLRLH